MGKKRHHFVPIAYLKFFCDEGGRLRVYLKDEPEKYIHQAPNNVGFHKYYYSQPLPNGEKDHEKLEATFSVIESKWPMIVRRLQNRENVNDVLVDLLMFAAMQRIRVPANRDASEKILAETVEASLRRLDGEGLLPPKPEGCEDILDRIEIAIDPHRSILAMPQNLRGLGEVFQRIGFSAIYNETDIPFPTSDNPVIWFDPSVKESKMQPYVLQPDGPVMLFFPVSPKVLIYGDTSQRHVFEKNGLALTEISARKIAKTINRQICKFAYKSVFAQESGQEDLIKKHAHFSPVLQTKRVAIENKEWLFHEYVFGPRQKKPRWIE